MTAADTSEDCELCGHPHIGDGPQWEHIAKLVHRQSAAWQQMAETLMDELLEWHHVDCPSTSEDQSAPRGDCQPIVGCTCHQPIRAQWDVLAEAEAWAHDEDEDEQP